MTGFDGGERIGRHLMAHLPQDIARGFVQGVLGRDVTEATLSFEPNGIFWTTGMSDEIGWSLYRKGNYEGSEIESVISWLSSGSRPDVIVDAGANVGTTSLPFAMAGYRVVAVEPVPQTFAMLQTNVDNNGLADRVVCVPNALGEESAEVEMWITNGSGRSEVVSSNEDRESTQLRLAPFGKITVQSRRLEDVLLDLRIRLTDVALVWADVQGSESSLIRGAQGLWAAGTPLYLEVDPVGIEVHEGIDEYVALIGENFSHFVRSNDLPSGVPEPIESFKAFLASIKRGAYTDALLIPQLPKRGSL
jgi:FkbM family methyltransferase